MARKKENLNNIGIDELKKKLVVLKEDMRAIKFKAEGSKPKNVKEMSGMRKQIARLMTEINQNKKQEVK
ncbi:MAG: 50S ribosomal protein L29 [Candidatus Paceibacterota bacterium]